MFKNIGRLLSVVAFVVLGLLIGYLLFGKWTFMEQKKTESATVVLEKMKHVTKLITVEGQLSELYNHTDYYGYDISPLRKKALVRVTATVSVGYDFEKMQINVYPGQKKVIISNFPPAEILAIDHDIDYYDISEGVFNGFETKDYNQINKAAKEKIKEAALKSNILQKADDQKDQLIQMFGLMLEGSGYTVEVEEGKVLK